MLSISTYWNSHRHHEDGLHMVFEALLLGFENLELSQGLSPVLMPSFYEVHKNNIKLGRTHINFTGVQNHCPKPKNDSVVYEFTSQDPVLRKKAIQLYKNSIDVAEKIGGEYVVLSLGGTSMASYTPRLIAMVKEGQLYSKPYAALKLEMIQERESLDNSYLNRVRQALDELIPYAQDKDIQLGLESGECYEQVATEREMESLLAEYDTPTVGYWHDFGHIQMKANLGLLDHEKWLKKMLPRLIGCHVHDVVWPAEDHFIPFQGDINFDQLIPLLEKNIPMVWEIKPRLKSDDIKEALITWKEKYGD